MNLAMKRKVETVTAVAMICAGASAADLNISVTVDGSNSVVLGPCGATATYEVTGVLSDTANEGLAGFQLSLSFDGGPSEPAATPEAPPMTSFDRPAGLTGTAGFGGKVLDGALVEVGGTQNTINNTPDLAPFPIGSVVTGVAHTETVLVTGMFTVPTEPGTYTLSVTNLSATVIAEGEDGTGFWATQPAGVGTITNLTVEVLPGEQVAIASNDGLVCEGDAVTLLGGPAGMVNYYWTGPGGFTSFEQNPVVSPALPGQYTLTVTTANNCTRSATTTVYTESNPEAFGEAPRYLAITPAACSGDVALFMSGDSDEPDVGCLWGYVQADGTLAPAPWYQTPVEWGTVYVADTNIIPGASYNVYDVYEASACPDLTSAAPATVNSPAWGDLNEDDVVDGRDLLIFVDAYLGDLPYWLGDLCPQVPDRQVDADDLLCWIDSYYREPYPYPSCDGAAPGRAGTATAGQLAAAGARLTIAPGRSRAKPGRPNVAIGGGRAGAGARLTIVPSRSRAKPGSTVSIDVFLQGARNLRAYQVAVDVVGGETGQLVLDDLFIDETRSDFVFAGNRTLSIADHAKQRSVSALWEGGADAVDEQRYLATFVFVATRDASGVFTIVLRDERSTFLRDAQRRAIAISRAAGATIRFGRGHRGRR